MHTLKREAPAVVPRASAVQFEAPKENGEKDDLNLYREEIRRLRTQLKKKTFDQKRVLVEIGAKTGNGTHVSAIPSTRRTQYRACEDVLFPGTWRVEPLNYAGWGCVYLFHGKRAQMQAAEFAKKKNSTNGNKP
jgi:hypothetical protein